MKQFGSLILLLSLAGCSKHENTSDCAFPSYPCLEGKWVEAQHTDTSLAVQEYIRVYTDEGHEKFFDGNAYNQLQMTPLALGYYYFAELDFEDSVSLTPVWQNGALPIHRYLKMISADEIETDYDMGPGAPRYKKRYVRQ